MGHIRLRQSPLVEVLLSRSKFLNDYIEIRRLYNGEDRQYAGIILPSVLKAWKTAAAATHYDPDLYIAPSIIKVLKDVNAEAPPPPPPKPKIEPHPEPFTNANNFCINDNLELGCR